MKSKIKLFAVLILISSWITAPVFAQDISFSPTRLFFKGNPGETVTEQIAVTNSGKNAYEFSVHIQDWKRDSLGNKIYAPIGTLLNSNGKYIGLQSTNLAVAPGERKVFLVSISIPKEPSQRTSNSMVFFTQTNAPDGAAKGSSGIGIKMSIEFGIQLFYVPYGLKVGEMKLLAFEDQNLVVEKKRNRRLAVKFENTGLVNKDGNVRFELTNKQTGEEIKIPAIPFAIMGEDTQWAYYQLPETLADGEYLAVCIVDGGDKNGLKVGEKNVYIKK